jgi:hypothetical protein
LDHGVVEVRVLRQGLINQLDAPQSQKPDSIV